MDDRPISRLLGTRLSDLAADGAFGPVPPSIQHPTEEDDWFVVDPKRGLEVASRDGTHVDTVFLHAAGHQGFDAFTGPLPRGIVFGMKRTHVLDRLTAPISSGEAKSLPFLGAYGPWDVFETDGVTLHVQFAPDRDAVELITLTGPNPAAAPKAM